MFLEFDEVSPISETRTAYAVTCHYRCCNDGKLIYLTSKEYMRQMMNANNRWECPMCGQYASWNDDNYDSYYEDMERIDNAE